ncbi:EamA family transporter [Pseudonocardia sp. KRD-184]|uniref:EamA family transporter n=1 Tax=Pseudonocardia oceani TaxID=2792013 RepID=A0ABS6UCD9_9PSEU|nr:EamA family transporter [Pseudonocardia oceani]MBW0093660.1 EamA family transporter [Pseudonocardia oceani]MBW0100340.1 EamA family transporter [Pseudonocardia oceani]MBW0113032.1 EamA family transporter [Pseudonocardia oceani]MBW0125783.1 EamA family transporter [Pseudonocardia oceani]MBW0129581.1 EamA family transporter [Pseudonocardia oceani]
MPAAVALPAALAYGVADFAGGLAARRAAVLAVTAGAQFLGLLALVPAVLLVPGEPSAAALGTGALAGIAGASGLLLYFRGLAVGPMGVVAPLSAVVGAGLPLLVGLAGGERLGAAAVTGLVVALAAIVLATGGTRDAVAVRGILLGLASGAGFGLFFVGLDATPEGSGLWPLLAGRVVSVTLLVLLIAGLCVRLGRERALGRGTRGVVVLVAVSGVFDSLANVLFLLATRLGDLGVSAVLVSLYPVVVVLLARVVLHERLTAAQMAGAGLALTASALLARG